MNQGKLLIDYDGKIPNLALMKVSAHFKNKGCPVYLNEPLGEYDETWLSCVFTWNRSSAMSVITMQRAFGKKVVYGGTGFDWGVSERSKRIELPLEIENTIPDFSLYPTRKVGKKTIAEDRAVGFAQRGCDRECQFCDVWKKEGKIQKQHIPISLIAQGRSKLLLLDNDLALSSARYAILKECRDLGVKVGITQGIDIRCVDESFAAFLAEDKPWDNDFACRRIYIAWDYLGIEKWVENGIDVLHKAGFKTREIFCYMICGFNTTHEQDLYRFNKLKEWGAEPYIMPFNKRKDDKWLNHFTRYVNRGYGRFVPIEQYKKGVLTRSTPPI